MSNTFFMADIYSPPVASMLGYELKGENYGR